MLLAEEKATAKDAKSAKEMPENIYHETYEAHYKRAPLMNAARR